jgi:hypothetical protein
MRSCQAAPDNGQFQVPGLLGTICFSLALTTFLLICSRLSLPGTNSLYLLDDLVYLRLSNTFPGIRNIPGDNLKALL